jgi:hypothetical protein
MPKSRASLSTSPAVSPFFSALRCINSNLSDEQDKGVSWRVVVEKVGGWIHGIRKERTVWCPCCPKCGLEPRQRDHPCPSTARSKYCRHCLLVATCGLPVGPRTSRLRRHIQNELCRHSF